ncbi:Conserved_hypothetical protein [Hexamita inflata]|uniref:Uncharacterized protein n=1 Tax=Hexamita inflata TaxID=28002 RepID=A0AA86PHK6_9EUKA|nr:Conserved hypothetical protein [Hexamita inflata]CAI9928902.1 Conserved hypothetical protein [Hexamita inflata]CAI9938708.1 Conserved hypothetical protein [Hexamita inflata]
MKKTRGKSFPQDLSNHILLQVTKQTSLNLHIPMEELIKNPATVVNSVLEKKYEVNWDDIARITNTPKRKCYKHFNETIAPKVTSCGFSNSDEKYIIDQMHLAIDRGQKLDNDLLEKSIKARLGDKYLKVTLLRKYNNLKRTKEIINHMEEKEREMKQQHMNQLLNQCQSNPVPNLPRPKMNMQQSRLKDTTHLNQNQTKEATAPVQMIDHMDIQYSNLMSLLNPLQSETNLRKTAINNGYLMSKTEDGEERKLVMLASALQNDYLDDDE